MSYIQSGASTVQANSASVTLTGVTAGSVLVAMVLDIGGSGPTGASDAQGSYTSQGSAVGPNSNGVRGQTYVLHNANSGSHTIAGTVGGGGDCQVFAWECSGPTSSAVAGQAKQAQAGPGAGTDAISSGTVTIGAASTLLSFHVNTTNTGAGYEPVAGTGFTSRFHNNNGALGSYIGQSKSASSDAAGTATHGASDNAGGNNYISMAIAILESGGGGGPTGPPPGTLLMMGAGT